MITSKFQSHPEPTVTYPGLYTHPESAAIILISSAQSTHATVLVTSPYTSTIRPDMPHGTIGEIVYLTPRELQTAAPLYGTLTINNQQP